MIREGRVDWVGWDGLEVRGWIGARNFELLGVCEFWVWGLGWDREVGEV